jgi:hypothetical protein
MIIKKDLESLSKPNESILNSFNSNSDVTKSRLKIVIMLCSTKY